MNRLLKAVSIITFAVMCFTLMTGCGERSAERKIGKEARYYIANKYGFRPQTTEVELRHADSVRSDHGIDTSTEISARWKNDGHKVHLSIHSNISLIASI